MGLGSGGMGDLPSSGSSVDVQQGSFLQEPHTQVSYRNHIPKANHIAAIPVLSPAGPHIAPRNTRRDPGRPSQPHCRCCPQISTGLLPKKPSLCGRWAPRIPDESGSIMLA